MVFEKNGKYINYITNNMTAPSSRVETKNSESPEKPPFTLYLLVQITDIIKYSFYL